MKQQEKKNKNKPNTDQTEELDAVEAFQTCHTSSKKGISEPAMVALVSSVCYLQSIYITLFNSCHC